MLCRASGTGSSAPDFFVDEPRQRELVDVASAFPSHDSPSVTCVLSVGVAAGAIYGRMLPVPAGTTVMRVWLAGTSMSETDTSNGSLTAVRS